MNDQKLINGYPFIAYTRTAYTDAETQQRARDFYTEMDQRRTCRDFSSRPVDKRVIEDLIRTASTAPSGAHKQPWTFCVIKDPDIKKAIRIAAEEEEKESYENRMSDEWLKDLAPLGTDYHKPFLEIAPYLIVMFKRVYEMEEQHKHQNYYVTESCGIACGMLLSAIHHAGLVALTHTPSPMNFLTKILNRPDNERPFLLIPVGYPADPCYVPDIQRKGIQDICVWY